VGKFVTEEEISERFAKIGMSVSFEADSDLKGYRKGNPLLLRELKALPDNAPVYVTYREHGMRSYRINGAYRAKKLDDGGWFLDDGSTFAADFYPEDLAEESQCYENGCGEGDFYLFHAVPKKVARRQK
jgi:hypothetical protein